jgi:hypothetical protein
MTSEWHPGDVKHKTNEVPHCERAGSEINTIDESMVATHL